MNKFESKLSASNKEIRADRSKIVSQNVQAAQEDLVRELQAKQRELTTKLMNLEDFGATSTTSLRVVSPDFDPKSWAKDMQDIKVELLKLKIEIEVAQGTLKEYFIDEES